MLKTDDGGMCCLGVLCQVYIDEGLDDNNAVHRLMENEVTKPNYLVLNWSELLDVSAINILIRMNDVHYNNFGEIANYIEQNL